MRTSLAACGISPVPPGSQSKAPAPPPWIDSLRRQVGQASACLGFFLVLCCASAQDSNLARMFDSKLSGAERNDACYALRADHSSETLQAMRKALNFEAVRPCAARNLLRGEAADLLADALDDAVPEVRATAARELGLMRKPEFIPRLATAAEDPNLSIATSATQALCQYDDRRVLPALRKIAGKGGLIASMSLGRIAVLDGNEALPIARKWLTSPDVTERVLAMRILGENGDASDLPALRTVAEHKLEVTARQRGFGLMPPINLSRAAQATIVQIETRVGQARQN
jgi:HEAT repeats